VLSLPELLRDQEFPAGNQVLHSHALVPWISARDGNIPAQSYGVVKSRRNVQETNNIAILERSLESLRIQFEFLCVSHVAVINSINECLLSISSRSEAAGIGQRLSQILTLFHLIDCRHIDATSQRHKVSHRWNVDHVSWKQLRIFALVACGNQIVEIKACYLFALALQHNLPH